MTKKLFNSIKISPALVDQFRKFFLCDMILSQLMLA